MTNADKQRSSWNEISGWWLKRKTTKCLVLHHQNFVRKYDWWNSEALKNFITKPGPNYINTNRFPINPVFHSRLESLTFGGLWVGEKKEESQPLLFVSVNHSLELFLTWKTIYKFFVIHCSSQHWLINILRAINYSFVLFANSQLFWVHY